MAAQKESLRKAATRVGGLLTGADPDPEELAEARAELATERLANHIERIVASAPPLSAEQRDRLASLLRTGGA